MATKQDTEFDALRNAIYHSTRRGFFDGLSRFLSFVIVAAGATAVVGLTDDLFVRAEYFAAVAALAGLLQLVFDFGGKARIHEFLQRRFYELAAEMAETPEATQLDVEKWAGQLRRLYAEEPPPMRALDAIAYNAALDSLGRRQDHRLVVRWWHTLASQWWPFNHTSFDARPPSEAAG